MNSLATALVLSCTTHMYLMPSADESQQLLQQMSQPPAEGYAPLMPASKVEYFKKIMPPIEEEEIRRVIFDPATMWYDDASMPRAYQDSVPPFVGILATRQSGGVAPTEFFQAGRFRFPFSMTGGAHRARNIGSLNFLRLPEIEGRRLPIVWWREGHAYLWMFPVGTIIGEVLIERTPNREWVVFEIRIRERQEDRWRVDALRPFPTAGDLADAVKQRRPDWQQQQDLAQLVAFLGDKTTIQPKVLHDRFGVLGARGGEDILPSMPSDLVTELLQTTTFRSSEGAYWKRHGDVECYAPTAKSYSVVPVSYDAGLIAIDELSCRRCHEHAGRPIGNFVPLRRLYGQVWGSDQIFSWHPFEPSRLQSSPNGLPSQPLRSSFTSRRVIQPFQRARHSRPHYQRLPRR